MVLESELDEELPEGGLAIPRSPQCGQALPTHVAEVQAQRHDQHWTKKAIVPFVVLSLLQFLIASFQTLCKVALTSGIDPLLLTFYRNFVAFLFLAPFAYCLEGNIRPKMTLHAIGSINLLAFFGILTNQNFFMAGLALTSALFAGVSQNLVPVITFLLAALYGMEKICFRRTSAVAKMVGTVICITGAVTMTLYKGVALYQQPAGEDELQHHHGFDYLHLNFQQLGLPQALEFKLGYWALGVLCLFLNCTSWGLYLIHQGPALERYPALLSMAALMEFFGCIQVAILAAAYEGPRFLDVRSLTRDQIIIVLYGGMVSATNFLLQAWCVGKVGAFLVSIFCPVQTLQVALMAVFVVGDTLYMGTFIGGILIIGGCYVVILGKQMEQFRKAALALTCSSTKPAGLGDAKQSDLEEPLLS